MKKGLGRYSIPIFLIARLAVDVSQQRKGIARQLMKHALNLAATAAERNIPIRAVVVDAIDHSAKTFYSKFGFSPWPIDGLRMWLLMKDLLASKKAATSKLKASKR